MPPRKAAAKKTATPKEEAPAAEQGPTKLLFAQDGRVIAPEEFGGPVVAPASDEPSEAIVDRSLDVAPRQEVPDASSFDHKTWAADATKPEEEETSLGASEGEEE